MVTRGMWKWNVEMIDYTKIDDKNHKNDYNMNKNVRVCVCPACLSIYFLLHPEIES